jgi:hypothetical protein
VAQTFAFSPTRNNAESSELTRQKLCILATNGHLLLTHTTSAALVKLRSGPFRTDPNH